MSASMELAYLLIDIGSWLIAIGITLGAYLGLMWCLAKLCEIGGGK